MRVDHGDRPPDAPEVHGAEAAGEPAASPSQDRAGSLIVHTPARLHRTALELHAEGAPWIGPHTAVHELHEDGRVHYEGVFSRLDAGPYELRVRGSRSGVVVPIVISPGAVVETWLDAPID